MQNGGMMSQEEKLGVWDANKILLWLKRKIKNSIVMSYNSTPHSLITKNSAKNGTLIFLKTEN